MILIGFSLVSLDGGCASFHSTRKAGPAEKLFAVTAESTPFYHHSPQQGRGPDKTIPRDTLLTLIRSSFGFCKVRLQDGEKGYVARSDIGAASAAVVASINAPAQALAVSSSWRAEMPEPRSTAPPPPLPEFEPTPLPQPINPGN